MPYRLTWNDADPLRIAFSPQGVKELVRPLIPCKGTKGHAWENKITDALVSHFGPWACGWRWAADEGSIGGGPIHSWCCPQHSLSTPNETADRVAAALSEWRAWIEKLAGLFQELQVAQPQEERIGHAVAVLVTEVVEQTSAGDAWYGHCEQVLSWFLEFLGVPEEKTRSIVEAAIGGRFESWVGPDQSVVDDVAQKISQGVALRRQDA